MLRARPLGEADRIIRLFTSERGKLDAVAKGVRRAKSHFAGRLEFGVIGDAVNVRPVSSRISPRLR